MKCQSPRENKILARVQLFPPRWRKFDLQKAFKVNEPKSGLKSSRDDEHCRRRKLASRCRPSRCHKSRRQSRSRGQHVNPAAGHAVAGLAAGHRAARARSGHLVPGHAATRPRHRRVTVPGHGRCWAGTRSRRLTSPYGRVVGRSVIGPQQHFLCACEARRWAGNRLLPPDDRAAAASTAAAASSSSSSSAQLESARAANAAEPTPREAAAAAAAELARQVTAGMARRGAERAARLPEGAVGRGAATLQLPRSAGPRRLEPAPPGSRSGRL